MLESDAQGLPSRKVLQQSEFFEIVSIEWEQGCLSEMHNHGWSQCSIMVQSGVFENIQEFAGKKEVQVLRAGDVTHMPVATRHEMRCLEGPGQSFHVYTPQLNEFFDSGKFSVKPEFADELDLKLGAPTDVRRLKKNLDNIRDASVSTNSPYFMNQLFSGVLSQSLMASELITQAKTTMATNEVSPVFSKIEALVVESLCEMIGWPKAERDGVPVPGGSAANFMAVHCARHKKFPKFKKQGSQGERFRILASSEAHYSLKKACVVLGLGTDGLVSIPADKNGRMDVAALDLKIGELLKQGEVPLMVCATAGTTVQGAFDPIQEISRVCQKHSVWLHVDAAWGGPAVFSKKLRPLLKGIDLADSVTFDAHKLFGADLTCSFFLTRHRGLLLEANDVSGGEYLFHVDDGTLDRGRISWQCGRRADAVSFWTIWKSLGTEGLGAFVDKMLAVREQTLEWVSKQERLKVVGTGEYLNVCLRVMPPSHGKREDARDWSRRVREILKEKNLAMVNYSTDAEGSFLRLILSHPRLQFEHVQQILNWALEV